MDTIANQAVVPEVPAGDGPLAGGEFFQNREENSAADAESCPSSSRIPSVPVHLEECPFPVPPHQNAVLDALPAHVALLDPDGTITAVNQAWRRFGAQNVLQMDGYCIS